MGAQGVTMPSKLSDFMPPERRLGPPCPLCQLPPDLRKQVKEQLDKGRFKSDVSTALGKMGHKVSTHVMSRHFGDNHDRGGV